ncbi:flagellar hook-associated protein 3 [Azoarcus sp. TTM-91]|uniref:flagellar hook-associated protein FlgL n=1 Tax=Azoarcus sp. TTM-91 TaxID=2691581 RepID=UPI00145EE8B3|nr:flagellar hook-associated protein FlgL [Azoarcus sp. TTM-91]NMG34623.1 flagellar hook-associated protein 3 [Azoarcus sp. TTM-91]
MRIASTQYHSTMNTALQLANVRLGEIMQKMATGQRLLKPSDDPIANVRLSRLSREEAALDQYRDNIGALSSRLTLNETHLDAISNDILQAHDLMVWAADGANTPDDVAAMASSLKSLAESIFYTANTKDQEGRYLFSGTLTDTPTITYDDTAPVGSRYSFTGNTAEQRVMVGNGVTQAANVTVAELAGLLNSMEGTVEVLSTPGTSVNDPAVRAQVTGTLDLLDDTLDIVSATISRLGGQQNILATLENNHANVSLSNQQAALDLGQLDYGDAAVKLNGYTVALQATQKAYGAVSQLSLFDVL